MSEVDIFLSYAREDLPRAVLLAQRLTAQGWEVFWDRTIPPGQGWREYIGARLDAARCVVVAWSETSVESEWVIQEAEVGQEKGNLVPVLLDEVLPPLGLRAVQAADLSSWDGDEEDGAYELLLAGLTAKLGPSPASLEPPAVAVAPEQAPTAAVSEPPSGESLEPPSEATSTGTGTPSGHEAPAPPVAEPDAGASGGSGGRSLWGWLSLRSLILVGAVGLVLGVSLIRSCASSPGPKSSPSGSGDGPATATAQAAEALWDAQAAEDSGDYAEAADLYLEACDGGEPIGCVNLGFLYEQGRGVAVDLPRAAELYRQGCDGGQALGCSNLGYMYSEGVGVERDAASAAQFYRQGCEGGNARGCSNLGILYENGRGVERDLSRAIELYRQACDGGFQTGCSNLDILREHGLVDDT